MCYKTARILAVEKNEKKNKQTTKKIQHFFPRATRVSENVALPTHQRGGGAATHTVLTLQKNHQPPRKFSLSQFFTTAKNPHDNTKPFNKTSESENFRTKTS